MRQQINLYQTGARQGSTTLSAASLATGLAAVTLLLVAVWFYGSRQVMALERNVATLRTQQQQQLAMTGVVGAARNDRSGAKNLQAQVKQLQLELAQHRHALELLRAGVAGDPGGFTARLEALARGHIEGIWIDHLVLGGATGILSLSGGTRDADLVPQYLRSLTAQPALAGTRFDEFGIEGAKSHAATITSTDAATAVAEANATLTAKPPVGIRFHATNSTPSIVVPDGKS